MLLLIPVLLHHSRHMRRCFLMHRLHPFALNKYDHAALAQRMTLPSSHGTHKYVPIRWLSLGGISPPAADVKSQFCRDDVRKLLHNRYGCCSPSSPTRPTFWADRQEMHRVHPHIVQQLQHGIRHVHVSGIRVVVFVSCKTRRSALLSIALPIRIGIGSNINNGRFEGAATRTFHSA